MQIDGIKQESKEVSVLTYTFLLLVTLIVYLPSIYFPFFFLDDQFYIVDNSHLSLNFKNIIWYWSNSDTPVTFNVWQFIGAIGGVDNPGLFRFVNIGLHFINGILLFKVLDQLLNSIGDYKKTTPFFVSLFFLVHPTQIESVVWVSSFKGILATFFLLIGMFIFSRRKTWMDDFAIIFFYILGLFSEPFIAVLPLFFFGFDYFLKKRSLKDSFLSLYTLIPTVLLLSYGLKKILARVVLPENLSFVERFFTLIDTLSVYFVKSFFPLFLSSVYGRTIEQVVSSFSSGLYFLSLLSFVIVFVSICFLGVKKRSKQIALGMLVFIVFFIPVCGLFSNRNQIISTVLDRNFYLPIIGIGLIGIELWNFVKIKIQSDISKIAFKSIAITFCGLMIFTSCRQVGLWSNELSIQAYAGRDNPNSFHVHLALGGEYLDRDDLMKAKYHLKAAQKLDEKSSEPFLYLVDAHVRENNMAEAMKIFDSIPRNSAEYIPYIYLLADGFNNNGHYRKAEELLTSALKKYHHDEQISMRKKSIEEAAYPRMIYSLDRILNRENLDIPKPARMSLEKLLNKFKKKIMNSSED